MSCTFTSNKELILASYYYGFHQYQFPSILFSSRCYPLAPAEDYFPYIILCTNHARARFVAREATTTTSTAARPATTATSTAARSATTATSTAASTTSSTAPTTSFGHGDHHGRPFSHGDRANLYNGRPVRPCRPRRLPQRPPLGHDRPLGNGTDLAVAGVVLYACAVKQTILCR